MTLDKLEQQVVLWSRMALLVPIVVSFVSYGNSEHYSLLPVDCILQLR